MVEFLPQGEITSLDQVPDSIPAYLINVIPELRINGESVMTGNTTTLGTDIDFRFNPTFVGLGTVPNQYAVPAGSYLSIATISNNVSPVELDGINEWSQEIVTAIQNDDDLTLQSFSSQRVVGDVFYAAVLGYYAEYASVSDQYGSQLSARHTLAAGLGSIGLEPEVDTIFGVPRNFRSGGAVANLPIIRILGVDRKVNAADYQKTTKSQFNFSIGLLSSSLEHSILEQFFPASGSAEQTEAFSTVKVFERANAAGQRLYQITTSNLMDVISNIHHDQETISEIVQAVNSGKMYLLIQIL